jgi:hypothetical protein
MAQKFEEEFNPWPSFVDLFSSVILVLLLFLLVLKVAKFPPCGFTIVLFLVLFGFLLQLIEFILNKKL